MGYILFIFIGKISFILVVVFYFESFFIFFELVFFDQEKSIYKIYFNVDIGLRLIYEGYTEVFLYEINRSLKFNEEFFKKMNVVLKLY